MRTPRRALQLAVLSTALLAATVTDAIGKPSFPAPPPTGRFISDTAAVIRKEDAAEIDRMGAALLADKGLPIRVVTVRSLGTQGAGDYTIERYAAELLQTWEDAQPRTHSMLLLVSSEDRRARIQLGSAWGTAHDDRARRVMDRLILPAFRTGELSAGILNGVRGFDAMGRQLAMPSADRPAWVPAALLVEGLDDPWWTLPALVGGVLIVVVGLVSLVRSGRKSWAWAAAALIFGLVLARFFGGSAEASGSGGGATGSW